ncbi:uncharacterized protein LOC114241421 [Bombyx mandarina]|uniref:Uncharacterized protein LOC114241421 n=1 Tax=Bombyx mandarina TaxID=7092 RepID=A0A6J2JGB2_BOMMA|nr:uncharacterized protein LOC114241421 [Bombyx mandarina]
MSKKSVEVTKIIVYDVDPYQCPFREFRDNELQPELWGMGPASFRANVVMSKTSSKPPADYVWFDDQTQPLPRSARAYLHEWIRAEELARSRWNADVAVFEENNGGKMSVTDIQLSHAQVLLRSSFCRRVMSICFILERAEAIIVEHQWENFLFNLPPEGWRAKFHIYSPGMKPSGGQQHKPGLSKNGCYLVRLFHLGAWRCVWVNDQVPVDATSAPLLPFSPLMNRIPSKPGSKLAPTTVTANVVHLWPLLICKALLKLAAPNMNCDEDPCIEDEEMADFNIIHALTGCMCLTRRILDYNELWKLLVSEVPAFFWDDDDETTASTVKSKSTKKPTAKDTSAVRRSSLTYIEIEDTKDQPPYTLPGITPGHEMLLLVTMIRDLPLKKPLPEPDVSQWKQYRWIDWARGRGLYEAYDCPRTKFLKVNGLMKLSYAPHLLDVQSTESITLGFRDEHERTTPAIKKPTKDNKSVTGISAVSQQQKEELREWIKFKALRERIKRTSVVFYPSMYQFTSAASNPPVRITKAPPNKALDIPAPKSGPMYLQIDSPEENKLWLSLSILNPTILLNSGNPIVDNIEPAYLVLERFAWFEDWEQPVAEGFVRTRGYDSVEVEFEPGRHFCRLWIHSRMHWHLMLLSESKLLLGTRDLIQTAAVRECPWASKFLTGLGNAFANWIKINRSNTNVVEGDREFYKSYQPDLQWSPDKVGYKRPLLHWMFKQALQSVLKKKLLLAEFKTVSAVLRRYFCDPDFGFSMKPKPLKSLREIADLDPCDCLIPEAEEYVIQEELLDEQVPEEKPLVDSETMNLLLKAAETPGFSRVCELATDELQCGVLKRERDLVIRKHEAATRIQALWRGAWARKCLNSHVSLNADVLKLVMESAFGNLDALSSLMNEFFLMFPGAKSAYSVASALSGVYGLQQFSGISHVTSSCKWIPFFQGVFYCHDPVKVHLDVLSTLQDCIVAVYNNDDGIQLPQPYRAHLTFDLSPNNRGYTVMGHGTLNHALGFNQDCHWQLTVLSSIEDSFHPCDNDLDYCKDIPLLPATKLHVEEMFVPNRRNILGGIQISVTKHEAIGFRAAATWSDLEMVAILYTITPNGVEELAHCSGKGELYWPYIMLEPAPPADSINWKKRAASQSNLATTVKDGGTSTRSLKSVRSKLPNTGKNRSSTKLREYKPPPAEPKQYIIQVIATNGWPLTVAQWKRVDEIRNSIETKPESPVKKTVKEKGVLIKEKDKAQSPIPLRQPQPGDAFVELECSLATAGGAVAKRDDTRDQEFAAARRSWDVTEPGRNLRGAQLRKEFRAEFLEAPPIPPSETEYTIFEEMLCDEAAEEITKSDQFQAQQGPTPATESGLLEMTVDIEEEALYLSMPDQLKDKFISLSFISLCTKERGENCVVMTPDIEEAAKMNREARYEAAVERMKELQTYNEEYVLERQKNRCGLLEGLLKDSRWPPELQRVLEERDDAIALEALNRTLSANKKKQDAKKK